MTPDENIDLVSDKIDKEVARFIEGVDKSQNGIFNRLLGVVKGIETNDNGDIKQTVKNLKLLANVRKTIENEILTDAYKGRVASLENQFPAISSLNNGYFEFIEASFNPNRELYKEVVKTSISATRASLLESGVSENVINPIVNIVNDSVTSGSTFADMVDELRVVIKGDEERLGQLMRYSKQITQDALNQFNATYNETIAKDLDLEWYFYSGGKRRTSRPFCKKYAGRYFHKKEVEDFGKRKDLDGSNLCGGSSKTDLCQGRVKGTNSSNIFKYRGGYNCLHLYKPTLINSVSKSVIKRNIEKGYYEADEQVEKPIEFVPATTIKEAEQFALKNDLSKKVDYKKANIDQANAVNKSLTEIKGKIKNDVYDVKTIKFNEKMNATANMNVGEMNINPQLFTDDIISSVQFKIDDTASLTRKIARNKRKLENFGDQFSDIEKARIQKTISESEKLIKDVKTTKSFVAGNMDEVIKHETGHMVEDVLSNPNKYTNQLLGFSGDRAKAGVKFDEILLPKLDQIANKEGSFISEYATKNGEEYFAESWLSFVKNENVDKIDKRLTKIFKDVTK